MDINIQKQNILKAALKIFSSKGFNGTTMGEIAAKAGVNPATIYRHFESKQALFTALDRPDLDFPDLQKQEIRRQIRQSALTVFSRKGYAAATMDEIAGNIGLSKAGVYFYYTSKEDLFKAALENSPGFSAIEQALRPIQTGESDDLNGTLITLAKTYLSLFQNEEFASLLKVILSEGVHNARIASIFRESAIQSGSAHLAGILSPHFRMAPVDLAFRIQAFFGMLFSWGLVNCLLNTETPIDDAGLDITAREYANLFMHGVEPFLVKKDESEMK